MAMNPISATYSGTGSQTPIGLDWRDAPNGFSYQVTFNAGASGSMTLDTTLDNLNAIPAPTPVWVSSSAITGSLTGFIGSPAQFLRLTINSLSGGTITLRVLEGAPDGGGDSSGVGGGGASSVFVSGGAVGLLGGSQTIGKVGIDQTTPGVTNAVALTGYSYTNISTVATTQVSSVAGVLHAVVVNTAGTVASSVTISDSTSAGTPLVAIINGLATGYYVFDANVSAGIRVTTTGTVAPNVTVLWR